MSITQEGETGLIVASENDSRDVVSVLLEAKADPNITDKAKLHYCNSHCLYNSNLMHFIIVWTGCSPLCCPGGSCRSSHQGFIQDFLLGGGHDTSVL